MNWPMTFIWTDQWPSYELINDLHMNWPMTFIWTHQWPSIELTLTYIWSDQCLKGTVSQMTNRCKKKENHCKMCMCGIGIWPLIYYISLKISCLFLTESSHDIVESSRYIPRDISHMRTTEISLNSASIMALKRMTLLKTVPLMLEWNAFGCIVFECRPIIYVCGDTFRLILFISKLTDHVIGAKCPYDEIPSIFKRGNPFSGERSEKEMLIFH